MIDWKYYDPTEDSTPLPQQYQLVEPGAIRRAWWAGFRRGWKVACVVALLGLGAGVAFGDTATAYSLHVTLTPASGEATVTIFAGALTTLELCHLAGDGIKRGIEAEVPEVAVHYACSALPIGGAA